MARHGRGFPNQNVTYSDNITGNTPLSGDVTIAGTGVWAAAGIVSGASVMVADDYPDLVVEWLPDEGPGVDDGNWVDITQYVALGNTDAGRDYELDRFAAGTCTLTLKSVDRLFDPEYTTGAFYGMLIPMRQLRVTATWDGVLYPVWRGYITDWGQVVWQDSVFTTEITAKDAFAILEQIQLPSSAWALEVQRDEPTLWLRLGETDTPRVTDSSAGGNYGIYDNCTQGAKSLVVNDDDPATAFAHSLEERVTIQNPNLLSGYPFTISVIVQIDASQPAGFKTIFAGLPDGTFDVGHPKLYMAVLDSTSGVPGTVTCRLSDGSAQRVIVSSQIIADGKPHHLAWVAVSAAQFDLYIDGALDPYTTLALSGSPTILPPPPSGYTVGNFTDLLGGDYGFGVNLDDDLTQVVRGTIDELCIWDGTAVDSDRIAAHALAALTGWADDTTAERCERFLDAIDWPDALRDIESGISILGPAKWSAGTTALAALQGWADTELGAFFVDGAGRVVWHSRHRPLLTAAATTSQCSFDDGHTASTLVYQNLELPRDEALIRNPVMAAREGGISVTVKDDTLIDKYGNRSWQAPNSQDDKDSTVRDRATWLLARYKELGTRLRTMSVAPRRDPTNTWPQALGRTIGDRITVNRTPLGSGNLIATDQIVERVQHSFAPKEWTTTFAGSPVDPNVGMYLILDDLIAGLLDSSLLAY